MKICPAIDTVAVRAPAELAAALSVTEPLALPDAPLVTVSQLVSLLAAVHAHPGPLVTAIDAVSPPAASVWLAGEIE